MGQVQEAVHNLQEAQSHYQLAKETLEALRGEVHGEELKISFVKNRLEVYENLIEQSTGFRLLHVGPRLLVGLVTRARAKTEVQASFQ